MNRSTHKMTAANTPEWYAVRVMYRKEMQVKTHLDNLSISNYIPMKYIEVPAPKGGGRPKRKLAPVIHNLIFVRTERPVIDAVKRELETRSPIRLVIDPGTRQPVVIPDKQMQDFIAVTGSYDEQLVFLDNETIDLKTGDRVRITGGPFAGVEGELMRIRGDRRVVVRLSGIMAVATAFIHPSLLEKIDRA